MKKVNRRRGDESEKGLLCFRSPANDFEVDTSKAPPLS